MLREPFAVGSSPLHRLDPRIRLVSAAVYSCTVAVCREFPALTAALLLSMGMVAMARLQISEVGR
jgi:cobalt/nickel transport system permease protein